MGVIKAVQTNVTHEQRWITLYVRRWLNGLLPVTDEPPGQREALLSQFHGVKGDDGRDPPYERYLDLVGLRPGSGARGLHDHARLSGLAAQEPFPLQQGYVIGHRESEFGKAGKAGKTHGPHATCRRESHPGSFQVAGSTPSARNTMAVSRLA